MGIWTPGRKDAALTDAKEPTFEEKLLRDAFAELMVESGGRAGA